MIIKFSKHANRPPTLNCVRDDGSISWFTASARDGDYFVAHDLLHYAVEGSLGYATAFYGLVAAGRDLNSFDSKEADTSHEPFSSEALDAERLVGLIQMMSINGEPPKYADLLEAWVASAQPPNSRDLPVSEAQLREICTVWNRMLSRWRSTEANGTLELQFPRPTVHA